MDKISTIYLKELSDIEEIFRENSRLPNFLKKIILFLKKIFCIVTINEKGFCILPYKELDSFFYVKLFFIKKILMKLNAQVILSKKLNNIEQLKNILKDSNIKLIEGTNLANYIMPEIIEYICKMTEQEKEKQEITLLIENKNIDIEKIIIELAKEVKAIQIVTNKMGQLKKLENGLESKYGLACQITNNKRKSLLKSKIIINFDYSEGKLNQFTINPNAIIIDMNNKTNIISKAFSGIHIYDYYINSDDKELPSNIFETKKIYEAIITGKNYEQIRKIIKEENVRVTNLIGKKGVIDRREYARTSKKLK